MTRQGHTPGPWAIEGRLVGGNDRIRVADCHVMERDTETNAANARLIASAPALLEALDLVDKLAAYDDDTTPDDLRAGLDAIRTHARAAIAKAQPKGA